MFTEAAANSTLQIHKQIRCNLDADNTSDLNTKGSYYSMTQELSQLISSIEVSGLFLIDELAKKRKIDLESFKKQILKKNRNIHFCRIGWVGSKNPK